MAIAGNKITRAKIDADAIDGTKVADDSLDSEHYAATSIDNEHLADNAVGTDEIANDAVTYAKIQNVSATDRILGRDSASAGVIEEITPANLRTMINVEDGATADQSNAEIVAAVEAGSDSNTFTDADHSKLNGIAASANAYVHPNHSGEVTSTADGATVIADNIVDEANLKVSNAPSNGYMLTAQSGDTGGLTWAAAGGGTNTASYNGIINGDFSTWQRGTAFRAGNNDDDTCTASRWVLLSDGNDIVDVVRSAGDVDSSFYSIGLDVETVDKKFGIVQIIENINTGALGGKGTTPVSLSFKAKVAGGGKLDNVKAAVIAWSGTADSVTSDVVSAWNAEGTAPTLATNWTYENTAANLSVTTSFADYKIENISVDTSSTNNVAVFIWSDVTDTDAGDFLYITDVQLEPGATANDFKRETHDATLSKCQRYYHKGQYAFMTSSATTCVFNINFPTTMRTSPTISHEYAEGGTANDLYNIASAATPTFVPNGSFGDVNGYRFAYDFDAGLTADDAYQAYFYFEAEL